MPFFTIISVSFNPGTDLYETVYSVLNQTFTDFEIIIKDAESVDNCIQEVPKDDRIKTYIKKDRGIYYGMNEALEKATGKYILFLNCGDILYERTTLEKIYEFIQNSNIGNCVVYGDYVDSTIYCRQPDRITQFYLYRTPLNHQSMLYSRKLLVGSACYDTSFKVLADYELTNKLFFSGVIFEHINLIICRYKGGGFSTKPQSIKLSKNENRQIKRRYFSPLKRFFYELALLLSLRRIRIYLANSNSILVRKLYRALVNKING